jgi:deoxyadenosine/deoxycytidine kinase
MNQFHYIVIEGPIGAGKTSLTRRLAAHLDAEILLEKPEENPFLANFYANPARHALQVQLFFLFQRINEVGALAQMDLFQTRTVSDYLFEKDDLFARLNLSDEEYKLYQYIYHNLAPQAVAPDLVIYLQATPETLIKRVRRRAISYEWQLTDRYLERLVSEYSEFFYHYEDAPVLTVNSESLNLVDNDEHFNLLLERIGNMRGRREFFSIGDGT